MTEEAERAAVVAEALSWIGTPYHSNADIKGAGVDCGMILVRIFVDTGLIPPFDPRPYPAQWMLHQSAEKYLEWVESFTIEIPGPPRPGDIVLFHFGKTWSHGSLAVDWPVILHATPPGPCMTEDIRQNAMLRRMENRFFSFWGKK